MDVTVVDEFEQQLVFFVVPCHLCYVLNFSSLNYAWYHSSLLTQLFDVVVFPCLICFEPCL
jgi:hypothetical protein